MKISVLKLCADGSLLKLWIRPSIEEVQLQLGGAVDTVRVFTGIQTFIRRLPDVHELEENICFPGIYGDVLFTGGQGSYLAGLSLAQMSSLCKLFRREKNAYV